MELMSMLVRPTPQTSGRIRGKEAALHLGVSVKKLRRLVRADEIHPTQDADGGPWLYAVAELDDYIQRRNQQQGDLMPSGHGGFDTRRHRAGKKAA